MTRLVTKHGFVCPSCSKHSIKRAAILPDGMTFFFEMKYKKCPVYDSCCFCSFESKRFLRYKELSTFNIVWSRIPSYFFCLYDSSLKFIKLVCGIRSSIENLQNRDKWNMNCNWGLLATIGREFFEFHIRYISGYYVSVCNHPEINEIIISHNQSWLVLFA